jgi:hypothetical protein
VTRFHKLSAVAVAALCVSACGKSARVEANEAAAIAVLKQINMAQVVFGSTCGQGGFADTLKRLTLPRPGGEPAALPTDFGASEPLVRQGYRIRLVADAASQPGPVDCNGVSTAQGYYLSAEPADRSQGTRSFATTQFMTIWELKGLQAPAPPFNAPAVPVQ